MFQTERVSFVCLIKKKKKSDVVNNALNAEWAAAIIIYSYIVGSGETTKQLSHYYTFSINLRKWFWQEIDMIAALPRRVLLKQTHKASIYIRFGLSIKFKSIKFTGEKISSMNEYKMIMTYIVFVLCFNCFGFLLNQFWSVFYVDWRSVNLRF